MKLYFSQFYLFVAGLIMLLVGAFIALAPNEYLMSMGAASDTTFHSDLPRGISASINLISDLRGMGGMLGFIGAFVFTSTFNKGWQRPALLVSTLVYSAFVVFRTTGFIFEGLPSAGILVAYFIELTIAAIGIFLMKTKRQKLADV